MEHKPGSQLTAKKNILIEAFFQGTQETASPESKNRGKDTNRKILYDKTADLEMHWPFLWPF